MLVPKQFITIGLLGALAVGLGALGAHFLKGKLETGLITPDQINGFDTAVKYQVYHVLAMLVIVVLKNTYNSKYLNLAYSFFFGGLFFSAAPCIFFVHGIYGELIGSDFLGPVTPIGGLSFVAGWLCLCLMAFEKKS